MRSALFLLAAALAFCGPSLAKSGSKRALHSSVPVADKDRGDEDEDWRSEMQNLIDRRQQSLRDHSDQSGRVRPDLLEKGIAQMDRMSVADQIGAPPKK